MEFFDSNCCIGRSAVINPGSFHSVGDLASRMADYGIGKALVYHAMARDHFPAEGNPLLNDSLAQYHNLFPAWVVMPHHTGEFPSPNKLMDELRENGVRAVRIYPSAAMHNYSMKPYSAGPLLEMLESHSVPMFVDIDEIGWDSIDILLSSYPSLPIVLCNTGYRADRYIYPLMQTYGNLYIETSRYLSHLGLEALCGAAGPDRILFGTAMPFYTGAGAVFYIKKLMLEDGDKEKIASLNLERLLNGVRL